MRNNGRRKKNTRWVRKMGRKGNKKGIKKKVRGLNTSGDEKSFNVERVP